MMASHMVVQYAYSRSRSNVHMHGLGVSYRSLRAMNQAPY